MEMVYTLRKRKNLLKYAYQLRKKSIRLECVILRFDVYFDLLFVF